MSRLNDFTKDDSVIILLPKYSVCFRFRVFNILVAIRAINEIHNQVGAPGFKPKVDSKWQRGQGLEISKRTTHFLWTAPYSSDRWRQMKSSLIFHSVVLEIKDRRVNPQLCIDNFFFSIWGCVHKESLSFLATFFSW